jgi:putative ATPase
VATQARPPLAQRMRPRTLDEYAGQEQLLGSGRFLRAALETGELPSLILWGPPGVGKTTLARLLAEAVGADYVAMSAVMATLKDVREQIDRAAQSSGLFRRRPVLFLDEIHRFNKAQQDALLPHVEAGTITLIGATTENPSFALVRALLSRARVVVLEPLSDAAQAELLGRALEDRERGLGRWPLMLEEAARQAILDYAAGDARSALGALEGAARQAYARWRREGECTPLIPILAADVGEAVQRPVSGYDRAGDGHYDHASALIKSLRGGDPDAALFYAARMLEHGEDAKFLFRRLVIFASEDIGLADPQALGVAVAALRAYEMVGLPEGGLALTQAILHLACAPKSNAVIAAWKAAQAAVKVHHSAPIPKHIINAPTALMKELGHGAGYQYPHDHAGHHVAGVSYLPEALAGTRFYAPSGEGEEASARRRLAMWRGEVAKSGGDD